MGKTPVITIHLLPHKVMGYLREIELSKRDGCVVACEVGVGGAVRRLKVEQLRSLVPRTSAEKMGDRKRRHSDGGNYERGWL